MAVRRLVAACFAGVLVVLGSTSAPAAPAPAAPLPIAPIDGAGAPAIPAVRLLPPDGHLAVVGDSLSVLAEDPFYTEGPTFGEVLEQAGWKDLSIDAWFGRQVSFEDDDELAGDQVVVEMVDDGVDANTWLIELGGNDAVAVAACSCPMRAMAVRRIRALLAEVPPTAAVYWVEAQNFAYPDAVRAFNGALRELVVSGEITDVVPWFATSAGHREDWYVDEVHLSPLGYSYWFQAIERVVTSGPVRR
jgi:lysophospholipase L1-like esterase